MLVFVNKSDILLTFVNASKVTGCYRFARHHCFKVSKREEGLHHVIKKSKNGKAR